MLVSRSHKRVITTLAYMAVRSQENEKAKILRNVIKVKLSTDIRSMESNESHAYGTLGIKKVDTLLG